MANAMSGDVGDSPVRRRVKLVAVGVGPLLALLCVILLPREYLGAGGEVVLFTFAGRMTLGMMVWMATWWLLEAVDVEATALLPLIVLPLSGTSTISQAAAPYAHHLIFLFMGGFMMALAMQRWGLDRRIALYTVRMVGTRPPFMIAGFMLATAGLSACVSNTATCAMMLPIALSVIRIRGGPEDASADDPFRTCLLLAIAYAASVGGVATVIGSPPNTFFASFAETELGTPVTFLKWLSIGLPVTLVFLPILWWFLVFVAFRVPRDEIAGGKALVREQVKGLGPMKAGEWATFLVFLMAVGGWMFRPQLSAVVPGLKDGVVAITAGVLLFAIPVSLRTGERVLNWEWARRLPFGTLILFGGGLSLAAAVKTHGVADFVGSRVQAFGGFPPVLLTFLVTLGIIFLTELTSNLATTATVVPILAALAPGLDTHPMALCIPATVAASCAFMLPVATPPNAIVFGSGYVTIPQMCRVGLWLNLIGVVLVTGLMYAVVLPLLGY